MLEQMTDAFRERLVSLIEEVKARQGSQRIRPILSALLKELSPERKSRGSSTGASLDLFQLLAVVEWFLIGRKSDVRNSPYPRFAQAASEEMFQEFLRELRKRVQEIHEQFERNFTAMERAHAELDAKHNEALTRVRALEEEALRNAEAIRNIENMREQIRIQKERGNRAEEAVREHEVTIAGLREQERTLNARQRSLTAQLDAVRNTEDGLRRELSALSSQAGEHRALLAEVEDLRRKVTENAAAAARVKTLESEVAGYKRAQTSWENTEARLRADIRSRDTELAELKEELRTAAPQLESLRTSEVRLREQLDEIRARLSEAVRERESGASGAQETRRDYERRLAEATRMQEALTEEGERLQEQLKRAIAVRDNFEKEYQAKQAELAGREAAYRELEKRFEVLQRAKEAAEHTAERRIAELEDNLTHAKRDIAEAARRQTELLTREREGFGQEREAARLERERLAGEVAKANSARVAIEGELAAAQKEWVAEKSNFENVAARVGDDFDRERVAWGEERASLVAAASEAQAAREAMVEEKNALEARVRGVEQERDELREQVAIFERMLAPPPAESYASGDELAARAAEEQEAVEAAAEGYDEDEAVPLPEVVFAKTPKHKGGVRRGREEAVDEDAADMERAATSGRGVKQAKRGGHPGRLPPSGRSGSYAAMSRGLGGEEALTLADLQPGELESRDERETEEAIKFGSRGGVKRGRGLPSDSGRSRRTARSGASAATALTKMSGISRATAAQQRSPDSDKMELELLLGAQPGQGVHNARLRAVELVLDFIREHDGDGRFTADINVLRQFLAELVMLQHLAINNIIARSNAVLQNYHGTQELAQLLRTLQTNHNESSIDQALDRGNLNRALRLFDSRARYLPRSERGSVLRDLLARLKEEVAPRAPMESRSFK